MSKAWGGVGAWALEAERAEAEDREQQAAAAEAEAAVAGEPAGSFPSLREAAAAKPKKKKAVTVPLSQFYATPGAGERKGLTPDEMLRLPTGPRERSQEELEYGRLGGGFRSYGAGTGARGAGFPSRRSDDSEGSWAGAGGGGGRRGYGGFDEEPRRGLPAGTADLDQPSRADEVDNWASAKKPFAPAPADSGRHDRYSSLGSGSSRADEVDSWSVTKKPLSSRSFGSGFGDFSRVPSDSDRWVRGGGGGRGGLLSNNGERPKLVLDPRKGSLGALNESVSTRPSPFGAARPREEVLAEKGLDWRKVDSEIESKKSSRPTSSHSSRPSSAHSSVAGSLGSLSAGALEVTPRPRPKVNPFGDAKPREVILQEKGQDWRKIDLELEHRGVDRTETEEEKQLKEEIDHLKALVNESDGGPVQLSSEELASLHEQIVYKERDLELLIRQLDDKVRFGQKATGSFRPRSGGGRTESSLSRPPSESGLVDESRSVDFMDRPRSRGGAADAWAKPMDDRQSFRAGRERSFFDNRNLDRSKSRERW